MRPNSGREVNGVMVDQSFVHAPSAPQILSRILCREEATKHHHRLLKIVREGENMQILWYEENVIIEYPQSLIDNMTKELGVRQNEKLLNLLIL